MQQPLAFLSLSSPFRSPVYTEAENIVLRSGFRIRIFFADPDPDPGKNFHADPDPDPGGIRGRGLGVKGKMIFFF